LAEAGFPDIKGDAWMGVFVPAGTSRDIIALLNREIVRIVRLSDIKERMAELGYEPIGGTPEEFAKQIKTTSRNGAR
jgi:tripartite-type tricarboxylate transporter receptor subunit TctC